MSTATLKKWGNSQGIIIPKSVCDEVGVRVEDDFTLTVEGGAIVLRPTRQEHCRTRTVTIGELFAGWEGEYEPPADWPCVGNEIDWGEPVGNEVW